MSVKRISRNLVIVALLLGQMEESLAMPPKPDQGANANDSVMHSESMENSSGDSHKNEQQEWDTCIKHINKNKYNNAKPDYILGNWWFNKAMNRNGQISHSEFAELLKPAYETIRKDLPTIMGRPESCLPKTIEEALESGKLDGVKQEIYLENFLEKIESFGIVELEAFSLKGDPFKVSTEMLAKVLWDRISQKDRFCFENKEWEEMPRRQDLEKILEDCGVEKLYAAVQNRVNIIRKDFIRSNPGLMRPLWSFRSYAFADLLSTKDFSRFLVDCRKVEKKETLKCSAMPGYFGIGANGGEIKDGFDLNRELSPACKAILGSEAIKTVQENTELLSYFKNSLKNSLCERASMICNRILTAEIPKLPASTVALFFSQNGEIWDWSVLSKRIWENIITGWGNEYKKIVSKKTIFNNLGKIYFENQMKARRDELQEELLGELPSRVERLKSSESIDNLLKVLQEDGNPGALAALIYENPKIYFSRLLRIVPLDVITEHLENPEHYDSLKTAIQNRHKALRDQAQEGAL